MDADKPTAGRRRKIDQGGDCDGLEPPLAGTLPAALPADDGDGVVGTTSAGDGAPPSPPAPLPIALPAGLLSAPPALAALFVRKPTGPNEQGERLMLFNAQLLYH